MWFEEPHVGRNRLRLCQKQQEPLQRLAGDSKGFCIGGSCQSDYEPTLQRELIPEKYHSLRDAKTYCELRRILERNGKYLTRTNIAFATRAASFGQCQQQRGFARDTVGLCCGTKDATTTRTTTTATGHRRVRPKLSRGRCVYGRNTINSCCYEEQEETFGKFAGLFHCDGIQWHVDYLNACIERAEEVKRRFVEKKYYIGQREAPNPSSGYSSVFKVQQSNSEVLVGRHVFRSRIMDDYLSNQEKNVKIENLIDNLYQLKLETAELDNETLPKIILTDYSSNPSKAGNEAKSVQNNNAKSVSKHSSLNNSVESGSDNHLNNNNGCFLQPHFDGQKQVDNLSVPTSRFYQSEARPP